MPSCIKELLNELKLKIKYIKERLSIEFHIDADEFSNTLTLPDAAKGFKRPFR